MWLLVSANLSIWYAVQGDIEKVDVPLDKPEQAPKKKRRIVKPTAEGEPPQDGLEAAGPPREGTVKLKTLGKGLGVNSEQLKRKKLADGAEPRKIKEVHLVISALPIYELVK